MEIGCGAWHQSRLTTLDIEIGTNPTGVRIGFCMSCCQIAYQSDNTTPDKVYAGRVGLF